MYYAMPIVDRIGWNNHCQNPCGVCHAPLLLDQNIYTHSGAGNHGFHYGCLQHLKGNRLPCPNCGEDILIREAEWIADDRLKRAVFLGKITAGLLAVGMTGATLGAMAGRVTGLALGAGALKASVFGGAAGSTFALSAWILYRALQCLTGESDKRTLEEFKKRCMAATGIFIGGCSIIKTILTTKSFTAMSLILPNGLAAVASGLAVGAVAAAASRLWAYFHPTEGLLDHSY